MLAAGCGESNTHSARDVRRVLARHGFQDLQIASTQPPREARTKIEAASLRLGLQLSYYASRLEGLAEHKTARADVVGDGVSVVVAHDPADAAWTEGTFRGFARPLPLRRIDNLVIVEGGPRVDAALADLK